MRPLINNDRDTALELWDAVDEDTIIYLTIRASATSTGADAMFMEAIPAMKKNEKDSRVMRIFMNKEEAESYKVANSQKYSLTLAKTNIRYLMNSLEKWNSKGTINAPTHCVLSTIDVMRKSYPLMTIWSSETIYS